MLERTTSNLRHLCLGFDAVKVFYVGVPGDSISKRPAGLCRATHAFREICPNRLEKNNEYFASFPLFFNRRNYLFFYPRSTANSNKLEIIVERVRLKAETSLCTSEFYRVNVDSVK